MRTKVVDNAKKKTLQSEVRQHVLAGSAVFADSLKSYEGLNEFQHEVVDHAVEYVRGEVHTNGLENFWSLVKRGLNGYLREGRAVRSTRSAIWTSRHGASIMGPRTTANVLIWPCVRSLASGLPGIRLTGKEDDNATWANS